jgi:hypothetical protein
MNLNIYSNKQIQQSGGFYPKEFYQNEKFLAAYKKFTLDTITGLNEFQKTNFNAVDVNAMIQLEIDITQVRKHDLKIII